MEPTTQTITCHLDHLATICADLASKGIAFQAKAHRGDFYLITILGY